MLSQTSVSVNADMAVELGLFFVSLIKLSSRDMYVIRGIVEIC